MAQKDMIKGIGNNVLILGVVSFLTDVSSEMVFPLIPIFLTTILGAGTEIVGLIQGIADSTASLVEIFAGYWADKTGKRKELVTLGYGLSSVVKIGIAFSKSWWQLLITTGAERIGKGIRTSPRDSIIAGSTSEKTRGTAFGIHRAMDTAGAILGPAIAYLILTTIGSAESGYRTVFFLALIPAFLAVLAIMVFVKEPKDAPAPKNKTPFWTAIKQMPKEYMTFLKVSILFSLSYFSFAFFIIKAISSGIKPADVLILYLIYNISYLLGSLATGYLSDRIGRKMIIGGAFALYGLVCIGFAFASTWIQFAGLFILYGIFVSADESVNKAYISDITESEKRAMAMGAYNTAVGVVYLPASLIIGAVWAIYGAIPAFSLTAGIAIVAAIGFFIFCRNEKNNIKMNSV